MLSEPQTTGNAPREADLLVGTSGYHYDDWMGRFYPSGLGKKDFLSYYSRHFSAVEINFTYYRMPSAKGMERMAVESGGRVEFVLKLHQEMTHKRSLGSERYPEFLEALRPLSERGVLGALLAQFPHSFHPSENNREYLRRIRDLLPGQNLVIEFRDANWVKQETFEELRSLGFGYCCVDEPRIKGLVPPVAVATSRTGYVRFHGRNAAKWYEHERPEQRYDYRYSREDLAEWAPKIRNLMKATDKVYCFTNNHFKSQSVESAQLLLELLGK